MTAQELAKAYAETLHKAPNAWGHHVHDTLGRSDNIMWKLRQLVGDDECDRLIDEALVEIDLSKLVEGN
jgi:hypothetical protein